MIRDAYDPQSLRALAISDTGFVFDPRTGNSFTANATALTVLEAMKDGRAMDEIAERVRERFDVDHRVEDDLHGFVELLRDLGLTQRPTDHRDGGVA